jgi:cytochrome d ubiquinol oxidase subunit II
MEYWLPIVWAGVIATAVALYVILDGFDLGIGILFPTTKSERMRDQMMNTVAPFWDGNETWLVLGGGGLWVAFPKAYAIIMPALYLPVIVMLLALIFRGVSFEFRFVAKPNHRFWDAAFIGGSIVAAFMQGVILGHLIIGIKVENESFAGGSFDWLAPFPLMCGAGLVAGYGLLGTTWLIMRTSGETAEHARGLIMPFLIAALRRAGSRRRTSISCGCCRPPPRSSVLRRGGPCGAAPRRCRSSRRSASSCCAMRDWRSRISRISCPRPSTCGKRPPLQRRNSSC